MDNKDTIAAIENELKVLSDAKTKLAYEHGYIAIRQLDILEDIELINDNLRKQNSRLASLKAQGEPSIQIVSLDDK